MSQIIHQKTGFPIADPGCKPFEGGTVSSASVKEALDTMILSASGWRKVFSAGGEESEDPSIGDADKVLIATAGSTIAGFIKERTPAAMPVVAVGLDTRPTGPVIADVLIRAMVASGIGIRYLFIAAAPEIMAYVKNTAEVDAFVYVSASHNPIGHNGLKIGMSDGAVLGGEEASAIIEAFTNAGADVSISDIEALLRGADPKTLTVIYRETERWKSEALDAYRRFSYSVLADSEDPKRIDRLVASLKPKNNRSIGILAELNGSARTLSIDESYLRSLGMVVTTINGTPRQIVHRIVPEGESLEQCRSELERLHLADSRYVLGYVPDNDGDRGNVVYIDSRTGTADVLNAQQVFALVVLAEVSFAACENVDLSSWRVVVNGPTSMRVDRICEVFGVTVVRSEVGEANVVGTARQLRKEGYVVRVMGEGSNGGNITYPAEVRDPLNTLGSLAKLLSMRTSRNPFGLWCNLTGNSGHFTTDFGIADVVETLPPFITTSAYEPRAVMTIRAGDHALLKQHYERIFLDQWERRKTELDSLAGIRGYREVNYEGTRSVTGMGPETRTGKQRGGLKMELTDSSERTVAFIWMRGSGTEPVFRILADVEGLKPETESYLLEWQRSMIEEADAETVKEELLG